MQDQVDDVAAQFNRAVDLHGQGKLAEAEAGYEAVIRAAPRHSGAHNLMGLIALQDGRLERSAELFRKAAEINPRFERAHANLGVALRRLGRPAEAVASYDAALALAPNDAGTLNNRGSALLDLRRHAEALASFDAALGVQPDAAMALVNRAVALNALERPAEALESADRAVALEPAAASAHYNRGNALMALERPQEALASFDATLALTPDYAEAMNNRGGALVALDRLHEGLAAYDAAVALRPQDAAFHGARAGVLLKLGRHQAALQGFERAQALDPTGAQFRWDRALTLLALGRFAEGWAGYEDRWKVEAILDSAFVTIPQALRARFDPGLSVAELAGKSVLVVGEQGVGDVIMFASILPDLMATAAKVSLICEPRLHRLFGRSFPALELSAPGVAPAADRVVALGSLGRLYRNRAEDFPGTPYLSAGPEVCDRWAERLGPAHGRLRIGLSWRGGVPKTGKKTRSIALAALRPLLELPGCSFVSLQYGDVAAELAEVNASLAEPIRVFPNAETNDFEDLAGLVQGLDLVVSVQTAVVHLCGATGTPALVMVPRHPEWRYAAGGSSMPWYSSVRLFRQGEDGEWAPIIDRVAEEVRSRANVDRNEIRV